MRVYAQGKGWRLWHGNILEAPSVLTPGYTLALCDPPYQQTACTWDRWPAGWVATVARLLSPTGSLWCWGTTRSLAKHWGEFTRAQLKSSQEVVWDKGKGTNFAADRFRPSHEVAVLFYKANTPWAHVYHQPQRAPRTGPKVAGPVHRKVGSGTHLSGVKAGTWVDNGTRLLLSVLKIPNLKGSALTPTEKPQGALLPLVRYSAPPNSRVLIPFAGSGAELLAALSHGCQVEGVELEEATCAIAATRLASYQTQNHQPTLPNL